MLRGLTVAVVVTVAACDSGEDAPTWHGDVRTVVDAKCTSCHRPGGIAPIDMTNPEDWTGSETPAWAALAAAAVADGRMPPWLPTDDCHPIEDADGLDDAQRETFAAWAEGGFRTGQPADYVAPEVPPSPMAERREAWGAPDMTLSAREPYLPNPSRPDDYRCIVIDEPFEEGVWVRGIEVVPDAAELVHHLIVYRFDPDQVQDEVLGPDDDDPGPGFACFSNPNAETVMAWAPGQKGEFLPDGIARRIPAGSRLVMQIHYNSLGRTPEQVRPDQTAVNLWLQADAESVVQGVYTLPFPNTDIFLPAGDPRVVERTTLSASRVLGDLPITLPLVGVMAHMHQLGTAISLRIARDGQNSCVLDIPRWDFDWQQSYYFPEDHWIPVDSSVELTMTCKYDNSAANQLVVNGEQLEPRDVRWGENTTDEMCLSYLMILVPKAFVE